MSLWAEYVKETLGREVIETDYGFASYHVRGDDCYLEDLYVVPEFRRAGGATRLGELVREKAIKAGCKSLTTTVNCTFKDPSTSLKACLSYGFQIHQTGQNFIVLRKEI